MALDQVQVNRLWEAVLLTSHELVWELDAAGIITFITDSAVDLFGVPAADLVGRHVLSLVDPEDVGHARGILAECVAQHRGWQGVRVRAIGPEGAAPWIETSGLAHVSDGGRLLGFTATTRRLDADDARQTELAFMQDRVNDVLTRRQLHTVWQPIHSLDSGRIVGVEALSRFHHRVQRPPDGWFHDAHEIGLGTDLEILALEVALRSAEQLPEGPYISLNVAPATVASGRLSAVLEGANVRPDRIVLELTEHVSIENYEVIVAPLEQLRAAGVRLAVDDAGAGFASFRHILRLRPDIIKLDQSITCGISHDPAQRALAAALVMFAMEAGSMTVIAEGVETADDLATVSTLGLDAVQGWYLSRPSHPDGIEWDLVIPEAWHG